MQPQPALPDWDNLTDLDATPKFIKFTYDNHSLILREAPEKAHIAYKNVTARAIRMNGDTTSQQAQFNGGAEDEATLVGLSLFHLREGGLEEPVGFDFAAALPRRIFSRIYKQLRRMSGMDEDQETVEFLERRIAKDQAKLSKLKNGDTPGKVEHSVTTAISV